MYTLADGEQTPVGQLSSVIQAVIQSKNWTAETLLYTLKVSSPYETSASGWLPHGLHRWAQVWSMSTAARGQPSTMHPETGQAISRESMLQDVTANEAEQSTFRSSPLNPHLFRAFISTCTSL